MCTLAFGQLFRSTSFGHSQLQGAGERIATIRTFLHTRRDVTHMTQAIALFKSAHTDSKPSRAMHSENSCDRCCNGWNVLALRPSRFILLYVFGFYWQGQAWVQNMKKCLFREAEAGSPVYCASPTRWKGELPRVLIFLDT